VLELYGRSLERAFLDAGARAAVYAVPNGEAYKSRSSKEMVEDWMVRARDVMVQCVIVTLWMMVVHWVIVTLWAGWLRLHASHRRCCSGGGRGG